MPKPKSVCLQFLDPEGQKVVGGEYLQCYVPVGPDPALKIRADGRVLWQSEKSGVELWVSQDDQVVLFRRPEAPHAVVLRAGRLLQVPTEKPVVLLDLDSLDLGANHFVVYIHGDARGAPEPPYVVKDQTPAAPSLAPDAATPAGPDPAPAPPSAAPTPIEVGEPPPKRKWWRFWK